MHTVHRPAPTASGLVGLLCLLCLGGVVGLGAGACSAFKGDDVPFLRVRPPVAFEMLRDNPNMAILDVRSTEEFAGPVGHVSGAKNIPLSELEARLAELAVLREQTFLVYCGHDQCGQVAVAALRAAGFDEAVLMDGGIDGWIVAGFGTVTGPAGPLEFGEDGETELSVE